MRPLSGILILLATLTSNAQTWNDFETPPHDYWKHPANDPATLLQQRMERGEITLSAGDDPKIFLRAYLEALSVPVSSQVLVFSKSSLQRTLVSGRNPRAMYFNEDTYVGWMPGGLIEVTGIDPVLGGVFYIFKVPDKSGGLPVLERRRSCMGCHAGDATSFLPGLMVRSLHTGEDGRTFGEASPHNGGHHTPFGKRWGGWYLTGEPSGMKHLANAFSGRDGSSAPVAALESVVPPGTHLAPGSDALNLMLHDHQVMAVNVFMEANYRIRTVLHAAGGDKPVAERDIPPDEMEMAHSQVQKMLRFLLFADEAGLPAPVTGDPGFRKDFAATRRPDKAGRALKDLSLQTHLLQFRCSYMIYSAAFRGLPAAFQRILFSELRAALTKDSSGGPAAHLPAGERRAIHEILADTVPAYAAAS